MAPYAGNAAHRGIDQILLGAVVIDECQQQEAGKPGEVRLVFEPVEFLGHRAGRHEEFLDRIEAAAMNQPAFPGDPRLWRAVVA